MQANPYASLCAKDFTHIIHDGKEKVVLYIVLVAIIFTLLPIASFLDYATATATAIPSSNEVENNDNNINIGSSGYSSPRTTIMDNSDASKLMIADNNNYSSAEINPHMVFGAYVPDGIRLEKEHGRNQVQAISRFLQRGFNDYYFVMSDFRNLSEKNSTEALLSAADNTTLRINIILLPPTEGGPKGNYDWDGWIDYFNTLKAKHSSSFGGFAIDDFNWADLGNGVKFVRNVDFMIYSNLSKALQHKRPDVEFYPVVYCEGSRTAEVVNQYSRFSNSIILVNANHYNVSKLQMDLVEFKDLFKGKSIYYFVYPTINTFYKSQGYDPPSDRLLMATLSIASRFADGIIFWHKIDNHVVRDFIQNEGNPEYLQAIHTMEGLQIQDEKRGGAVY